MLFGKPNYRVTSSSRRPSSFDYPKPPLQLPRETDPETKIADARSSGWMTDQQSKCPFAVIHVGLTAIVSLPLFGT
jgi:hypothetical protein